MNLEEFKNHLKRYMSETDINELVNTFSRDEYKGLYLNNNYVNDDEFLTVFPNLKKHPIVPNAYLFKKEDELGKNLYFNIGWFYIQEPSSTIVPYLLDIKDNELILDMCAAPGGKALFAALKNKNGIVVANDISKQRAQIIIENEERLGIDNVIVTSSDFTNENISNKFLNTFDKIILDAPCSGSGMFRKDDKMMDDWNINKVYKCQEIQKKLILNAYKMLKPGGVMTYSTCSYSYEEDEDVVRYLLSNTDATLIPIFESEFFYHSDLKETIHLLPSKFEGEGQYVALIKKPGNSELTMFEKNEKCALPPEFKNTLKNRSNIEVNSTIYSLNNHFDAKPLFILRYGVKALEIENKIYKATHHLAKALNLDNNISLDYDNLNKYLKGNELDTLTAIKGYTNISYSNTKIGLGKVSNGKIKNHYPKGLRK